MSEPVAVPVKESAEVKPSEPAKPVTRDRTEVPSEVEPPYSDYKAKTGKPYSVDYFELGDYWDHGEMYQAEIGTIQEYLDHLVETGEVNNTLDAVKAKLKSVERMIHSDPSDRKANRVALMAAHFDFLAKADGIRKRTAKMGMV